MAELEGKIGDLPWRTRHFLAAIPALLRGRYAEAERNLTELIATEPEFGPAHAIRGMVRLRLRRIEDAIADFETAREKAPRFDWTWIGPIELAMFDGDLEAAEDLAARAQKAGASSPSLALRADMVHRARRGPLWTKRFEWTTPHFRIASDHSRDLCKEVGHELELAMNRYKLLFPDLETRTAKARIYVFADRQGYVDYGQEKLLGHMYDSAGAYQPALRELLVFLSVDRQMFLETLRHEGFHRFLHRYLADAPIWFNEGSAQYFGIATEIEGGGFDPGAVDRDAIAVLVEAEKRAELTPLARLAKMDSREFMENASLHYAQSWALVHFLQSTRDGKLRGLYRRYFAALKEGLSAAQAWEEVLEPHGAELEKLYREHYREM